MAVIDRPEDIEYISIFALRQALRAQARGMSLTRGRDSALTIAKRRGLTTSRTAAGAIEDVNAVLASHPGNPRNQ